ncbi:MAG: Z1 domain-containing protein [Opitutae bacterium]|nr:Z1 domain-containing protein [Opitutae bacterium]
MRNQTQKRLNEAFIGINDNGMCGVSEGRRRERKHIPFRLTTDTKDFDKNTAQRMVGGNFDTISVPIVLIIKKNATILKNLTNWLTDQYREVIADHSMLVIDDEADYASINTKDEDDPATINRLIRLLLGLFNKSAYVAYTATPFANIFIDYKAENPTLGKDLFPKDFIFPIDLPGNYVGAAKLFGSIFEDRNVSLVDIDDHQDVLPIKHKKDFELVALPESLRDAIRVFLINVAIRNLRGHNANQHNSMLVHVTLYTLVHMRVHNLIDEYLIDIRNAVVSFAKLSNYREQSEHFRKLEDTFKVQQLEKNENLEYTWSQVLDSIHECIETVIIRQVHSNKKVPQLEYKDSQPLNVIVVGGLSLSRGYTLEGLSATYFLRGTKLNDTLMQMGRWFGYRDGYEDLCRIYLTPDVQDHYAQIHYVTEDLFESFELMADQGKTPYDFGLAVIEHPDNILQVTAKNKMKATALQYVSMNLEGHLKETAWLSKEEKALADNLKAIKKILSTINEKSESKQIGKRNDKSYLWQDIDGKHIEDFLNTFKVYGATKFVLRSRMPLDFVKQFVREYSGKWDVSLHGGQGQPYSPIDGIKIKAQMRRIENKGSYREVRSRQVSSGSAEAINLPDPDRKKIGDKRKLVRAFPNRNHLLMLHILDDHENENEIIAAYGVSFSGDGTGERSTRIRMNQTMIDEINNFSKLEEEETENEE